MEIPVFANTTNTLLMILVAISLPMIEYVWNNKHNLKW